MATKKSKKNKKVEITSLVTQTDELAIDYKDATIVTEPSPILVGGVKTIQIEEMDLRDIESYLYLHPVIPRGIEIKANKTIGRGYTVTGPHEEANEYIKSILKESGGIVFLKKLTENAWAFGNGWAEIIANKAKNLILKCEILHPVYFNFAKKKVAGATGEEWHKIIDPATKKPSGYQQYKVIDDVLTPFGPIVPSDRAIHLAFDTWGDEVEGISLIRYVRSILSHLLTIERAGAVAGERVANPRYKFTTNIKNEKALKKFAQAVDQINERDAIILTEGNDVDVLIPGNTNFNEYHDKFLNLLAVRLGIPKTILFGDGTNSNKACYSADTEVLTENGWKLFKDVMPNEQIAQYNPEDNVVSYTKHEGKIYEYDIDENMYYFENKSNDILVTNNHRMLIKENGNRGYSDYLVKEAKDISRSRIKVKSTGDWKGTDYQEKIIIKPVETKKNLYENPLILDINDYLEFLGYYLSEGGFSCEPINGEKKYNITFAEHNSQNKIKLFFKKLEEKYNIHFSSYQNKNYDVTHFNLTNKQIWTHLSKSNFGKKCYNKKIPRWILNLPKEKLLILLEALIQGDGTTIQNKIREKSYVYYTTSSQLKDDVQELAFKCGFTSNSRIHYEANKYKKSLQAYRIFINKRSELVISQKQITQIPYKGKVYCLNVPTGILITRRNGKIAIQGNTLQEMAAFMREEGRADEEILKQVIQNQLIETAILIRYGENFPPEQIPVFDLIKFVGDEETQVERMDIKATVINKVVNAIQMLKNIGEEESAQMLLKYLTVDIVGISTTPTESEPKKIGDDTPTTPESKESEPIKDEPVEATEK